MLRTLRLSIFYQLLMSLRMKQALFFTLFFPVFLFVLFGNLWGAGNDAYIPFILTGILGMTAATEGIFAIGPAVKDYYGSGILRYFKKLPFPILIHFSGLIVSQLLMLLLATSILLLMAQLVFGLPITLAFLGRVAAGVSIGVVLFGFIGLATAFLTIRSQTGTGQKGGIANFVYYIVVFLSNAFYPIADVNVVFEQASYWSPMNPILNLMRGEAIAWLPLAIWLALGISVFLYRFRRFTSAR